MTLPKQLPPFVAFVVGVALFAALAVGMKLAAPMLEDHGPAFRQVVLKGAMVVLSIAIMLAVWRPRRVWGVCAPRSWVVGVILPTLFGALLGAAATAVILTSRFPPMGGIREMGVINMIGAVWFGSTFAEEVFTRGLIQGWMQPTHAGESRRDPQGSALRDPQSLTQLHAQKLSQRDPLIEVRRGRGSRILASGLLFGAMHVSLFIYGGNDPRTAGTIVAATTLLGLTCAWSRERGGSLIGPLLSHFAFNMFGLVGGALTVLIGKALGFDLVPAL